MTEWLEKGFEAAGGKVVNAVEGTSLQTWVMSMLCQGVFIASNSTFIFCDAFLMTIMWSIMPSIVSMVCFMCHVNDLEIAY
jgi:hypothetical protein